MKTISLKKGKEIPVKKKHHWIFSGAVQGHDRIQSGSIVAVKDFEGKFLGHAFYNHTSQIMLRMINFSKKDPIESIKNCIASAVKFRKEIISSDTNAYRLINSEGDGISGLTVDVYDDVVVLQISSLGIDKIKDTIVDMLVSALNPGVVYEKSAIPSRSVEGLEQFEGILYGDSLSDIEIKEQGVKFYVNVAEGHKTGFYLDQREMRKFIGELSQGKSLLNCFSYTGGFSVYAALNGASKVTSVDISNPAIEATKRNFELNELNTNEHDFIAADVFEFLKEDTLDYDIVILDPPAFAKKKKDVQSACNGYGQINRLAFQKMKPGSLLLTCSCSYHVGEDLFFKVIQKAARDAGRNVRVIGKHIHAADHCINIHHPELGYLKSLLLFVE